MAQGHRGYGLRTARKSVKTVRRPSAKRKTEICNSVLYKHKLGLLLSIWLYGQLYRFEPSRRLDKHLRVWCLLNERNKAWKYIKILCYQIKGLPDPWTDLNEWKYISRTTAALAQVMWTFEIHTCTVHYVYILHCEANKKRSLGTNFRAWDFTEKGNRDSRLRKAK